AARELERVGRDHVGAGADVVGVDGSDRVRLAFHLVAFPGHAPAQHLAADAAIEDDGLAAVDACSQVFVTLSHVFVLRSAAATGPRRSAWASEQELRRSAATIRTPAVRKRTHSAPASTPGNTGRRKMAPADDRTALGLNGLTVAGSVMSAAAPSAKPLRIIVP